MIVDTSRKEKENPFQEQIFDRELSRMIRVG